METYISRLEDHDVSVTTQRVKILEFLDKNRIHPTAEEVFMGIKDDVIKISKATVYNTLNLLVEKKIINEMSLFENTSRFDYNISEHSHFKCINCGKIVDINQHCDLFENNEFEGNIIIEQHHYAKGICKDCTN